MRPDRVNHNDALPPLLYGVATILRPRSRGSARGLGAQLKRLRTETSGPSGMTRVAGDGAQPGPKCHLSLRGITSWCVFFLSAC